MSLCSTGYQSKVFVTFGKDKFHTLFQLSHRMCMRICVLVCICARVCLRVCLTFWRAGRVTGELALTATHWLWNPALPCSTVTSRTHTHTHAHICLIDQLDLHITDRPNFSPFPSLANLWPLICTGVNLYTVITRLCSLFSRTDGCCVVCNTEHWHMPLLSQHKRCKESTGPSWKTQVRARCGANGFPLCVLCVYYQLVSFPVVSVTWHHLGRTKRFVSAQKGHGNNGSSVRDQGPIQILKFHFFLELTRGKVPLVNDTFSSNFVLNANTVLRSVVPV